jgi:hypothetical protein
MSTGPALSPDQVVVRVDAIERESRAVVSALGRARGYRLALLVLVFAFAAISVTAFYQLFTKFKDKDQLDALVKKAETRLSQRSDLVTRQVELLVNHSAPKLSAAFGDQAKQDMPQFLRAAGVERDAFVTNLQSQLQVRMNSHYKKLLERQQRIIDEEYPDVQDPKLREAMMANILVAVDRATKKYFIEQFEAEFKAMYATWDDFPIAEPPGKGELPLEDQLVGNMIELLKIKLAQTPNTLVSGTP